MFSETLTTLVAAAGTVLAGPLGPLDVPDHTSIETYLPLETTQIFLDDGSLAARIFVEDRILTPVDDVPDRLRAAFIAAEDQNFYDHHGVDFKATFRAAMGNVQAAALGAGRLVGASTITQQVAKNLFLSSEVSVERKIREAILAIRIEEVIEKDKIIEIYLNHIYFGQGAYGVGVAAATYFGKSLMELTLAEMAYLAALPKAPSYYHPVRQRNSARIRRNYVLGRMLAEEVITEEEANAAREEPIVTLIGTEAQPANPPFSYYTAEVRRILGERYGGDQVATRGLTTYVSMDPRLQALADSALRAGVMSYDRRHGYRGPITTVDETLLGQPIDLADGAAAANRQEALMAEARDRSLTLVEALAHLGTPLMDGIPGGAADGADMEPWLAALRDSERPEGTGDWRLAVVLAVERGEALIGLEDGSRGRVPFQDLSWARRVRDNGRLGPAPSDMTQIVDRGDVIAVVRLGPSSSGRSDRYGLRQIPELQAAIVVMDHATGRVLALSGGFDYEMTEFNRATQAARQPGSSFKPFVYLTALEAGYGPETMLLDLPIQISQAETQEVWRPRNYDETFLGATPLRVGIERSRNLMTVRLLTELGIEPVAELAGRFGLYEGEQMYYSSALGSQEVTLLELTTAFAMIANGGQRIRPSLIDRIEDRYGRTIFRHDDRECLSCGASAAWVEGTPAPTLTEQPPALVADASSVYLMRDMLRGVAIRGTAARLAGLGLPLAGKTGTTNDFRDAWFMGFSPRFTVGVFAGFDDNRTLGRKETGSSVAVPIFSHFMREAHAIIPPGEFVTPPGVQMEIVLRPDRPALNDFYQSQELTSSSPSVLTGTGGLY